MGSAAVKQKPSTSFKSRTISPEKRITSPRRLPHNYNVIESGYEKRVHAWLDEHNISFIQEYHIPCLPYRRYDFYLPKLNTLIEVDGEQHFRYIPFMHKNRKAYYTGRQADNLKTLVALNLGYRLIRIDYQHLSDIDKILHIALNSRKSLFLSDPTMYQYLKRPLVGKFAKEYSDARLCQNLYQTR